MAFPLSSFFLLHLWGLVDVEAMLPSQDYIIVNAAYLRSRDRHRHHFLYTHYKSSLHPLIISSKSLVGTTCGLKAPLFFETCSYAYAIPSSSNSDH